MMESLKKFTAKTVVAAIFLGITIVFAGVMSFIPYLISLDKIRTSEFWTDETMSLGLVLVGFITMMVISMNVNSMNPRAYLAIANRGYSERRAQITNVNDFGDWHDSDYLKRDKAKVVKRYLEGFMINDVSLLELDRIDIKSMQDKKATVNGREYPSLSKEQVKALIKVKEGKIRLPDTNAKYYLTTKAYKQEKTISEEIQAEGLKKNSTLTWDIFSKMLLSFAWTFVLALFVRDMTAGGDGSTANAWGKFAMRMVSIGSGMFSGFMSGYRINNLEAHYVELRNIVIDMYLADKKENKALDAPLEKGEAPAQSN